MEKYVGPEGYKKLGTFLDLCVSSLRRGHANLLCIIPVLSDDPRRESDSAAWQNIGIVDKLVLALSTPRAPRGSHAGPTRVPSGPTQAPLSLDSSAAKREIPRAGTRDPRGSYAGPTRVPRGSHSPSTPYLPSSFSCKTRNSTCGPHTGPILSLIPHRLGFKILL